MNSTSPLNRLRGVLAGLGVALVLGCGLNLARPQVETRPTVTPESRLIVDGQETHGGGKGGKNNRAFRVADGQETHGKGGKGIA